jgi:hypothetical protein
MRHLPHLDCHSCHSNISNCHLLVLLLDWDCWHQSPLLSPRLLPLSTLSHPMSSIVTQLSLCSNGTNHRHFHLDRYFDSSSCAQPRPSSLACHRCKPLPLSLHLSPWSIVLRLNLSIINLTSLCMSMPESTTALTLVANLVDGSPIIVVYCYPLVTLYNEDAIHYRSHLGVYSAMLSLNRRCSPSLPVHHSAWA